MNCKTLWLPTLVLSLWSLGVAGCDDKPAVPLAPTASALAPAKPAAAGAQTFEIDKATSKIEFMMEAPKEKIRGRVPGATVGDIQVDLSDITKTTALLHVDISGIELFQAVMDDKTGKFSEETKSETQNQHARAWLQISDDGPEKERKENSRVQFSVGAIENASAKDVQKMTGAERKVTFNAKGEFLLHGHKTEKVAEMEATFKYAGDKPVSVTIKTVKPFAVGLAEHDVRPRETFGKLAAKTLDVLAPKVAKEALVSIDLTANLAGGTAPAGAAPAGAAPAGAAPAGAAPAGAAPAKPEGAK
jgi:hypothetical protein